MLMISSPPVGAIAFGRSGVGHIITALEADRVVLRCPDGLKRVPLDAVIRWELPPTKPTPGQRVRHRQTQHEFTVVEVYKVRCDRDENDEPFFETWARLTTADGKPAHWKLSQLEEKDSSLHAPSLLVEIRKYEPQTKALLSGIPSRSQRYPGRN